MADWRLHCQVCGWPPPPTMEMAGVQQHMVGEHDTDQVHLDLVPHCPDDDAAFDLSESGDSGQCPTCGRFEILRVLPASDEYIEGIVRALRPLVEDRRNAAAKSI